MSLLFAICCKVEDIGKDILVPVDGVGVLHSPHINKGDDLLPFTGPHYNYSEYRRLNKYFPHLQRYALMELTIVYIDGDVEHGNVVGFIKSSWGRREEVENVYWEYIEYPCPWDSSEWGYVTTNALKDIKAGSELFCYYWVNI